MPDSPPGRNEEHSTEHYAGLGIVPYLRFEDGGIEEERQSEAWILDTDLNRDRPAVTHGEFHEWSPCITCCESAGVVNQYKDEDEDDVLDEELPVGDEHAENHHDEHSDGEYAERLLDFLRSLREKTS